MILVFDFDGVIVDSLEIAIGLFHSSFGRFLKTNIEPRMIREQGLLTLLRNYRMNVFLIAYGMWYLKRKEKKTLLPVFSGVSELLMDLSTRYRMILVSSNSKQTIAKSLSSACVAGVFEDLHAGISLLGKGRFLRKIARKNQGLVVYIGDEARDIFAAREAGVTSIATAWGWESEGVLESARPDYLVKSPQELRMLIQSLGREGNEAQRR